MIFIRHPHPCTKHFHLLFALLFFLMCSVLFCGCFGTKTPERTYFSIDYTLNTQPKHASQKYNKTVVLQNVTSALAYDRQEIVYRANPYEFQYYWYRLWASKPRKMLRELIAGHLRYTNMFKSVTTTIEDRMPDYMLDVEISSIEELDVSDKEWYAHLALHFTLQRVSDSANVWTYDFDARRAVADNQPVYVVKAMSELLDAELVKAFEDMDRKLGGSTAKSTAPVQQETIDFSEPEQAPEEDLTDQPRATLKNKPE